MNKRRKCYSWLTATNYHRLPHHILTTQTGRKRLTSDRWVNKSSIDTMPFSSTACAGITVYLPLVIQCLDVANAQHGSVCDKLRCFIFAHHQLSAILPNTNRWLKFFVRYGGPIIQRNSSPSKTSPDTGADFRSWALEPKSPTYVQLQLIVTICCPLCVEESISLPESFVYTIISLYFVLRLVIKFIQDSL